MKKILFISIFALASLAVSAQLPGGGFNSKNHVLYGESEIVLKDSTVVPFRGRIDGKNFSKTGVSQQDVAYVRLVKTNMKGFENHNGNIYKFISIDGKPTLVQVAFETPKISFYQARPKMTGGGYNAIGIYQQDGTRFYPYILKSGDQEAIFFDLGKNRNKITELFPECPRLVQYQKDERMNEVLGYRGIAYIYNGDWEEATPEQMEEDYRQLSRLLNGE